MTFLEISLNDLLLNGADYTRHLFVQLQNAITPNPASKRSPFGVANYTPTTTCQQDMTFLEYLLGPSVCIAKILPAHFLFG
jgi:hypothetical protein